MVKKTLDVKGLRCPIPVLKAEKIVKDNWGDWSKTMKLIGEETGAKGKDLFMPIRASITGQLSGPELDQVTEVMGQERVIKRLKEASAL